MTFNLCQHFSQYFSLSIADNQTLLEEVYRIRYKVYCEELNYEPPANFPDGMEKDIYDRYSLHCLLKHKSTGMYAGCVRIILPPNETNFVRLKHIQKDSAHLAIEPAFPWQKFSSSLVYPNPEYQWTNICEISRLAVRSEFRKRKGDDIIPLDTGYSDSNSGKRRFPLIAMSLYWAAFCLALNLELDVFAIMEPRLARHLRRCGLRYTIISNIFEHRGKRAIFYTKPAELLEHLDYETYEFFSFLNNTISQQLLKNNVISSPREFEVDHIKCQKSVAFVK